MDKKPLNGAKAPQASEGVFGGPEIPDKSSQGRMKTLQITYAIKGLALGLGK